MSLRSDSDVYGTLVVPAYEADRLLARTLPELRRWAQERSEPWELVFVDDGSHDATGAMLEEFRDAHPEDAIRVLRFVDNRGKGFAVRAGLAYARGRFALFADCDLTYPVADFDRVVARLAAGADVAVASRAHEASRYRVAPGALGSRLFRHLYGRIFNALCRLVALSGVHDSQAGLKGFRTELVQAILPSLRVDRFAFDVELLRALRDHGASIEEIPVEIEVASVPSTVRFGRDALRSAWDALIVGVRARRGAYRSAPGPTALVIHADDLGIAPATDRVIEQALRSGVVTSASILVGGAAAEEALAFAASHPEYDFGVHLDLTLTRPVLPAEEVPTLVDLDGRFLPLPRLIARLAAGGVDRSELLREWRSQIHAARRAGVRISHLDSHQHVHLLPGILEEVAVPLAAETGLALRTMDGPVLGRLAHLDGKGAGLALASRRSGNGHDRRFGTGTRLRDRATLRRVEASLREGAPGGVVELVVHPGEPDETLRASRDRYLAGRVREWELIRSQEMAAWLRMGRFRLTDFRGLGHTAAATSGSSTSSIGSVSSARCVRATRT